MPKHRFNPEGFRNPDDLMDPPTAAELSEEIRLDPLYKRIGIEFSQGDLTTEQRARLEICVTWMINLLVDWKSHMQSLIDSEERISEKIRKFLENRQLDLPEFSIMRRTDGEQYLSTVGMEEVLRNDSFVIRFQLPKPLAMYYWKGDVDDWNQSKRSAKQAFIAWGNMYELMMPVVWSHVDAFGTSSAHLRRINPYGMHDSNSYYYLWEVSPRPFEDDFEEQDLE